MNQHYKFINQPLPYAYDALEPYIDTLTMHLHHDKHLQTYIDNLNKALTDYPFLQKLSLEQLIYNADRLPPKIQTTVKNNAGGVYNHEFYFAGLLNSAQKEPTGMLALAIIRAYGDFDNFKSKFTEAALSVFGSGYAWLVLDERGDLKIITTANQDTPLTLKTCPILNIDVWEHAYYLKHYNMRVNYIADWFQVVNWNMAEQHYLKCSL